MFGQGFKHEEGNTSIENGNYSATILTAELKNGSYGDYIQGTVSINGNKDVYPNIFLMNDSPKQGFGQMSAEQALKMWNVNMTKFFASFGIKEGDFNPSNWIGKTGTITVQPQKNKPQYKEIVMWKKEPAKAKEPAETSKAPVQTKTETTDGFPEDVPF